MKKILLIFIFLYTLALSATVDDGLKALNDGDYIKALEILENNKDNKAAQFNLGIMYKNGYGVKKDLLKSKDYLFKSCQGGLVGACSAYETLNFK